MVQTAPQPSETVLLRPTPAQRVVGALSRSLCAAPILLGGFVSETMLATSLIAAAIAATVVFILDLLVRADQAVELRVDCLVARGRTYPWWAIDDIEVVTRFGRSAVRLDAFGVEHFELDAPRSSVLTRNRRFAADAEMIAGAWERLRQRDVLRSPELPPSPASPASPGSPEITWGR